VKIKKRTLASGAAFYYARFIDPDTGRQVDCTLDKIGLPSHDARRQWAISKARALARRSMDLQSGAPRNAERSVEDALADFYKSGKARLTKATVARYRTTGARLQIWAERVGVGSTDDITRARLSDFREALIAPAGRRGTSARSPFTVNSDIAGAKAIMNHWRRNDLLPRITRDDISDALRPLPTPQRTPSFLRHEDCGKLLEAALRHDRDTFAETREEHLGGRPKGTTRRHDSIAPYVTLVLLTGCRKTEALSLCWSDVDLDAVDPDGRLCGEIRLRASATKTKRDRIVALEVCPGLRRLLAAMKLRAGRAEFVFSGDAATSGDQVEDARARLIATYGAPAFTWQRLRATTGTYLTNAPGIFAAASAYRSAAQLGHSVAVAEKHYLGVLRNIARDAHTLEAAMKITSLVAEVVDDVSNARIVPSRGGSDVA
jgi:integrase